MNPMEFSAKTVEDALHLALKELNLTREKIEYTVLEEGSKGLLGIIGSKPARIRVEVKKDPMMDAKEFLHGVLDNMNVPATIDVTMEEEDVIRIELSGPKMGLIIGYRGETLDALQYLTSLVVNKERKQPYYRVVLDTEGYRVKREETLKRLADKTAYKVSKYRRPIKLEPMNPYERRIIHAKLQGTPNVKTFSVGEEPFRRVVVELDK